MSDDQATTAPELDRVLFLRRRQRLDRIDELRLTLSASLTLSQGSIARALSVSQPTIHSALRKAMTTPPIPAGFSGGSPYEIALRFSVGQISRDTLVDELTRWAYTATPRTDGVDWITEEVTGTFTEVVRAYRERLIDAETYDLIFDGIEAREGRPSTVGA